MDPRLTRLYQDELAHLREMGGEFAREHPKIAARLGLEGMEVADPYVERLLEGFAFLAARVQLKLEAEQPRLIAHLLESIYPNFLAPVPSMAVMRLRADTSDPNLTRGYTVPRGSAISSLLPRGQNTLCEFRTAMSVVLWPVELSLVQYFSFAPDLPLTRLPAARGAKGGLRLRLRCGGGLRFNQLALDRLPLFISAPDDVAFRLHELVMGSPLGSLVLPVVSAATSSKPTSASAPAPAPEPAKQWRDADSVQPLGLLAEEALLPESLRAFSGHRLLQETAALPQRLLFFDVVDLRQRLAAIDSDEADLVLLFARGDAALEPLVDDSSIALHCTPTINLFPRRLDRVTLTGNQHEYHLVPDRTRPMDLEVHSIDTVVGHGDDGTRDFKPLYAHHHALPAEGHGYFTLRREPRRPSDRQRVQGARVPSYMGEEVFISLADAGHGPFRQSLRQLSVSAWVSNRDLPVLLPAGQRGGGASVDRTWQLDVPGPVTAVDCLRGPTRPVSRRPVGDVGWKLVSQLTQNHLALGDNAEQAAAALRDTLRLYGPPQDTSWSHLAEGLRSLRAKPVVRRLPIAGPLSFGSGTELTLEVDEHSFQGHSAFLLGTVLDVFFARHASINSFTQLTLSSVQRGVIKAWPPRLGLRQVV
jgi:type VI secretion system protein ImpG